MQIAGNGQVEAIECLVIGHVSLDESSGGVRLGGSAAYASVTARKLGYRAGVVTAAQETTPLSLLEEGVQVCRRASQVTTRFQNTYAKVGQREQILLSRASKLDTADIPTTWINAPVVFLAPIAQEIDEVFMQTFSASPFVGLLLQGCLRKWDGQGRVSPAPWKNASRILPGVSAVVFSLEDVGGNWSLAKSYAQAAPLAVITLAEKGAVLFRGEESRRFRARPAQVVDPTGAGDVFAAAFFLRLYETGDPVAACRFANAMASFSTEGEGWDAIPLRSEVETWLSGHSKEER
ncbi:MAG: hypothetical protein GXP41_04385 [Chloroflexi bacterium]|nr:hypothetical protein [Chloroflexota bacterium]